jgi:hypothetical protein
MSHFEVARSTTIEAGPERVHALIDDFHEWVAWSPWEDLDPELRRTYTGPASGVGAHYAWAGNRKAGAGSMEITRSSPTEIGVHLIFLKPWKASSEITFLLTPSGAGTDVTWRMAGENKGMAAVVTKLFSMDKMVGKDFEKGLGRLKDAAEA